MSEPTQPLNVDGEPLHTGDDDRIDCVASIRAALEEIIDEEGKPECDHCADLLSGALDECEKLDKLLIDTIARERNVQGAPACAAEWQPIETAPKDSSAILVYSSSLGSVICRWQGERDFSSGTHWATLWDGATLSWEPIAWMPLPSPPCAVTGNSTIQLNSHPQR